MSSVVSSVSLTGSSELSPFASALLVATETLEAAFEASDFTFRGAGIGFCGIVGIGLDGTAGFSLGFVAIVGLCGGEGLAVTCFCCCWSLCCSSCCSCFFSGF